MARQSRRNLAPRPIISQFKPEQRNLAWKAMAEFRALLPSLRAFARTVSGNPKFDVQATTGTPHTKNGVVFIQPPLELGRERTHDRPVCGRRAANGRQLCPACQVNEVISFFMYHEIGHVIFNSEAQAVPGQFVKTYDLIDEWHPVGACEHAEILGHNIALADKNNPLNSMQLLTAVNQFLPMIFNCLEDSRVNEATFRARPGLRAVFDANVERLMEAGSEISPGQFRRWIDDPLDAQFMIGLYLISSGHYVEGRLADSVVDALRTADISVLCESVIDCKTAHEVFDLSIEAFRVAQHLGFCVVPKCEIIPQQPGQPDNEDQDSDSNETGEDDNTSGNESGNSSEGDKAESSDGAADSDSSSGDSYEESDPEGGDTSDDAGEAGESSGDNSNEEVNDDATGTSGGDTESDDSEPDSGDGADSDGSDDKGERSELSDDRDELDDSDDNGDGGSSSGGPGTPGATDDSPGEQGGSEQLDDADDDDEHETSDGSGMGGQDGAVGSDDESPPVDEDATDAEEADDASECDHVGEYECDLCGADLTLLDDDPWASDSGPDIVPVDGPSDAVDALESPAPDHGTPEDAATSLARFLMHPVSDDGTGGMLNDMAEGDIEEMVGASEDEPMDIELAELVRLAGIQSQFFEKDSAEVEAVVTASYPEPLLDWDINQLAREIRTSVSNILKSVMPDEGLIGKATQSMRRVFQENMETRRNRNLRAGRLDMRSLARRAPVGDDRLFGKKTKPRGKSYAVVIGLDCSGSTCEYGRNLRIRRATMALAEILTRLGVPWAGFGHTAYRTRLDKTFKSFSMSGPYFVYLLPFKTSTERWTDESRKKLAAIQGLSENLDGHTLEQYINYLAGMEGDEKILFYYTDGQMPASNYDEEREVLIAQCERAKRLGIHLIGVGINTDSPSRYGMETVQIDSDEDIHKVIALLEQRLTTK
jgi:cobalamin biosynthesis protein CobT